MIHGRNYRQYDERAKLAHYNKKTNRVPFISEIKNPNAQNIIWNRFRDDFNRNLGGIFVHTPEGEKSCAKIIAELSPERQKEYGYIEEGGVKKFTDSKKLANFIKDYIFPESLIPNKQLRELLALNFANNCNQSALFATVAEDYEEPIALLANSLPIADGKGETPSYYLGAPTIRLALHPTALGPAFELRLIYAAKLMEPATPTSPSSPSPFRKPEAAAIEGEEKNENKQPEYGMQINITGQITSHPEPQFESALSTIRADMDDRLKRDAKREVEAEIPTEIEHERHSIQDILNQLPPYSAARKAGRKLLAQLYFIRDKVELKGKKDLLQTLANLHKACQIGNGEAFFRPAGMRVYQEADKEVVRFLSTKSDPNDRATLSQALRAAKEVVEGKGNNIVRDQITYLAQLNLSAREVSGKSSFGKKLFGALCVLTGAALFALTLSSVHLTFGLSLFGTKLAVDLMAEGLTIALGGYSFFSGRQKGISKALQDLKAVATRNHSIL